MQPRVFLTHFLMHDLFKLRGKYSVVETGRRPRRRRHIFAEQTTQVHTVRVVAQQVLAEQTETVHDQLLVDDDVFFDRFRFRYHSRRCSDCIHRLVGSTRQQVLE